MFQIIYYVKIRLITDSMPLLQIRIVTKISNTYKSPIKYYLRKYLPTYAQVYDIGLVCFYTYIFWRDLWISLFTFHVRWFYIYQIQAIVMQFLSWTYLGHLISRNEKWWYLFNIYLKSFNKYVLDLFIFLSLI